MTSKQFDHILSDVKTDNFECCCHIYQLHMHEFSNSIGLLGSSCDTALLLRDEELHYEPCETTAQQNMRKLE